MYVVIYTLYYLNFFCFFQYLFIKPNEAYNCCKPKINPHNAVDFIQKTSRNMLFYQEFAGNNILLIYLFLLENL